jgi:hypothetical protein
MNVYLFNNILVSPINERQAITQHGEIIPIHKSELSSAKLLKNGVYDEKFIQMAIGGLKKAPGHVGKLLLYEGNTALAYVEPQGNNLVKFSIGLPNEAFGPGAEKLNDMKINKDKAKDFDKDTNNKKDLMKEINDLDALGEPTEEGPEELKIDDSEGIGGIKKLVLEWNSGIDNLSIDEIKEMFGEGKDLPEPDIIKLETDTESIVRKKGKEVVSAKDSNSNNNLKKAYYGPTPVASSTCPKCQSKLVMDWKTNRKDGKFILKCLNPGCKYEMLYEGSLDGQGVAGQSNTEPTKD